MSNPPAVGTSRDLPRGYRIAGVEDTLGCRAEGKILYEVDKLPKPNCAGGGGDPDEDRQDSQNQLIIPDEPPNP